jgi:hypothetical protein
MTTSWWTPLQRRQQPAPLVSRRQPARALRQAKREMSDEAERHVPLHHPRRSVQSSTDTEEDDEESLYSVSPEEEPADSAEDYEKLSLQLSFRVMKSLHIPASELFSTQVSPEKVLQDMEAIRSALTLLNPLVQEFVDELRGYVLSEKANVTSISIKIDQPEPWPMLSSDIDVWWDGPDGVATLDPTPDRWPSWLSAEKRRCQATWVICRSLDGFEQVNSSCFSLACNSY